MCAQTLEIYTPAITIRGVAMVGPGSLEGGQCHHNTPHYSCFPLSKVENINIHFQDLFNRVELKSMNASTSTTAEQTKCFGTYKPLDRVFCRGRQVNLLTLAQRILSLKERHSNWSKPKYHEYE